MCEWNLWKGLRRGIALICCSAMFLMPNERQVLQVVAWTRMLYQYSQGSTVSEALQKTFDGKHPCEICKRVAHEGEFSSGWIPPLSKFFCLAPRHHEPSLDRVQLRLMNFSPRQIARIYLQRPKIPPRLS
jgi:hypothetical protein